MLTRLTWLCLLLLFCAAALQVVRPAFADELRVHCGKPAGSIRPLHGVNGGPLCDGETVDLSSDWRKLKVPIARMHDCDWPAGRVVDMYAVFPSLDADPKEPGSYQFDATDDYLAAVLNCGSKVVYRLGESIEHARAKQHVHPPADFEKWSAAALGIIRHYNHGWAGGYKHDIRYWEIWNEPENRPACWTGTDADYYRLYSTASKTIKAEYPRLKLGGPAVGSVGEVVEGEFRPTEFVAGFVRHCREQSAPLDFFSWHTYSDDPAVYGRKAKAIRRWLDREGFATTEIHLNEWNHLPRNDWSALSPQTPADERRKWFDEMHGARGAAFMAYVLSDLQDSPIDVANYFHGDNSSFGLFTPYGEPRKTFHAMEAFARLLETPDRLPVEGAKPGELACLAGANEARNEVSILVSRVGGSAAKTTVHLDDLPWSGPTVVEEWLLDEKHDFQLVTSDHWASGAPRKVGEELATGKCLQRACSPPAFTTVESASRA
jgi:xylan 1,4-beta-xylosidase